MAPVPGGCDQFNCDNSLTILIHITPDSLHTTHNPPIRGQYPGHVITLDQSEPCLIPGAHMLRMTPCNQHPAHFLMLFVSNARHSDIRKESHPLTVVVTLSNHQWYVRDFIIGTNIRHSDISFSLLTLVSLRIILLLLLLHCQDYTPKSSVACQGLRDFMIGTNARHSDMNLITQFHKLRKEKLSSYYCCYLHCQTISSMSGVRGFMTWLWGEMIWWMLNITKTED